MIIPLCGTPEAGRAIPDDIAAACLCLALLRVGFTMRSSSPKTRCALTTPFHPYLCGHRRSVLCCTFLRVAPTGAFHQHPALWSPDFPRHALASTPRSSCPARPNVLPADLHSGLRRSRQPRRLSMARCSFTDNTKILVRYRLQGDASGFTERILASMSSRLSRSSGDRSPVPLQVAQSGRGSRSQSRHGTRRAPLLWTTGLVLRNLRDIRASWSGRRPTRLPGSRPRRCPRVRIGPIPPSGKAHDLAKNRRRS